MHKKEILFILKLVIHTKILKSKWTSSLDDGFFFFLNLQAFIYLTCMIKWIFFPTQKKILGNNSKKQKTKLEQTEIQYFFLINTLK